MYTIVTGAAGFIGSNIIKGLNARGIDNIIAVDNLTHADKFLNIADCNITDYLDKREFLQRIEHGYFDGGISAILHQGACSDTMETDGRYMMENNYHYSQSLLDFCLDEEVPFLYASSASVYGANNVFEESRQNEKPLNVYGYSKFLFDQYVRRHLGSSNSPITGFRYFNVYGPREQHKGRMASVAFHFFHQFENEGCVKLFEGWAGYDDGEQRRDFVFIEDVVKINLHFLDTGQSGIFNLGTGRAQSFNEVAVTTINACRIARSEPVLTLEQMRTQGIIEYVPFPKNLKGKYQSFTQADITRLRSAGYLDDLATVEHGVASYIRHLLHP